MIRNVPLQPLSQSNNPDPPLLQQHNNKIRIMMKLLFPPQESQEPPHTLPQFVASKSLIWVPPKFLYSVSYVGGLGKFPIFYYFL